MKGSGQPGHRPQVVLWAEQEQRLIDVFGFHGHDSMIEMKPYLIHHFLEQAVQNDPDCLAYVGNQWSLTYGELEAESEALAHCLKALGTRPGDRVGILMEKSKEAYISIFAVSKCGASYVPLDLGAPPARQAKIMRNCEIVGIIGEVPRIAAISKETNTDWSILFAVLRSAGPLDAIEKSRFRRIISWSEIETLCGKEANNTTVTDEYPACILHTSGSTGVPKGVTITHRNIVAFVAIAGDYFDFDRDDRFVNHAPFHFDLSIFDIFVATAFGSSILPLESYLSAFPEQIARHVSAHRATVWNSVPSALSLMIRKGDFKTHTCTSLRTVMCSGEVWHPKDLLMAMNTFPRAAFYNVYGQTEANSSLCYKVDRNMDEDLNAVPIGIPFENMDVFGLDSEGREIDSGGQEGELFVCSPAMSRGYWNNHSATNSCFVQDPREKNYHKLVFRTGDRVKKLGDGNYVFLGRMDQVVKVRGHRVDLREIEAVVSSLESVATAVAMVRTQSSGTGEFIIVCISGSGSPDDIKRSVMQRCKAQLPAYMVPEEVYLVHDFPRLPNGKIDRKALATHSDWSSFQEKVRAIDK